MAQARERAQNGRITRTLYAGDADNLPARAENLTSEKLFLAERLTTSSAWSPDVTVAAVAVFPKSTAAALGLLVLRHSRH